MLLLINSSTIDSLLRVSSTSSMSIVGLLRRPYADSFVPFRSVASLDALNVDIASILLAAGASTTPRVTPLITYGNGVISLLPDEFCESRTPRSVFTRSAVSIGICIASSFDTRSDAPAT